MMWSKKNPQAPLNRGVPEAFSFSIAQDVSISNSSTKIKEPQNSNITVWVSIFTEGVKILFFLYVIWVGGCPLPTEYFGAIVYNIPWTGTIGGCPDFTTWNAATEMTTRPGNIPDCPTWQETWTPEEKARRLVRAMWPASTQVAEGMNKGLD